MKSKLSMIIIALFVAFMLVNSASAQKDGSKPEGRSDRVYLKCTAGGSYLPPHPTHVIVQMTNNTAAWLAEGKDIHFSVQQKTNQQTVSLVNNQILTLDVMVPPNGSVVLWDKLIPTAEHGTSYTCQAWFIK